MRLAQVDRNVNFVIRHGRGLRPALAGSGFQSYQAQPLKQRDVRAHVLVVAAEQSGQFVDRRRPMAGDRQQEFEPLFGEDAPEFLDALEVKPRLLRCAVAARDTPQGFAKPFRLFGAAPDANVKLTVVGARPAR